MDRNYINDLLSSAFAEPRPITGQPECDKIIRACRSLVVQIDRYQKAWGNAFISGA